MKTSIQRISSQKRNVNTMTTQHTTTTDSFPSSLQTGGNWLNRTVYTSMIANAQKIILVPMHIT